MIQCKDCDLCEITANGATIFRCNPFENIKEPECVNKWMLMKLDILLSGQMKMLYDHNRLAPIQDKIIKYMEREIGDMEESDSWKYEETDNEDESENFPF